MCYYIGIEDLVGNALIEIVEKTHERKVCFQQLSEYGEAILAKLKDNNAEAILIFTKDKTNRFFHDCTDFFIVDETDNDTTITLKEGVLTDTLRNQFRINIGLELLRAFVDASTVSALGINHGK